MAVAAVSYPGRTLLARREGKLFRHRKVWTRGQEASAASGCVLTVVAGVLAGSEATRAAIGMFVAVIGAFPATLEKIPAVKKTVPAVIGTIPAA